jgi:predicted nuclease of restriction endonuclease-like (RecB) superfamily
MINCLEYKKGKRQINMSAISKEYKDWFVALKGKIRSAQAKAAMSVNTELIRLYWELGKEITEKQTQWGTKFLTNLSKDLQAEFPNMGGLTLTNLKYCRSFYQFYTNRLIGQQPVDQLVPQPVALIQSSVNQRNEVIQHPVGLISWSHNILVFTKTKDVKEALFYIQQTLEKGWSRDLLLNAIKMNSYAQAQKQIKSNNFNETLSTISADYANQVFKNSYNLGFLGITEPVKELELENRLIAKIRNFILELGRGFTFIGNQHRLEYNGKEYFVDMLFFHRGLCSLVALELKIGGFKAEYVGKMNLYLSLLDKLEKGENENQSIGIILCADKDHLDVEIALQDVGKPIGVAEYQLLLLKDELQAFLVSEIKAGEENKIEIESV